MSWKAPPKLKEPYVSWKEELLIWQNFTEVDAKKQGSAIFLSLPNPSSARDAVLELGAATINGDAAVAAIIAKLDTLFLKDDNVATYQAWQAFIKYKRDKTMSMTDYTIEFNKLYNLCKKAKLQLPTGVLAIQYLESANLAPEKHALALATCGDMTYDSMRTQVLKITTDLATPSTSSLLKTSDIKVESDTLHAEQYEYYDYDVQEEEEDEEEEATDTLYGSRYPNFQSGGRHPGSRYQSSGRYNSQRRVQRGNNSNWRSQKAKFGDSWNTPANNAHKSTTRSSANTNRSKQPNPPDRFGRPLQCRECLSIYHLEEKCPEIESQITLLTDEAAPATSLLEETMGYMVVDSGCIHTVCGTAWLESYMESLSCKDKKSINIENGQTMFRFGNGASFRSLKRITLPIYIGKLRTRICTDVVECEIPLLFSKNSLKRGSGSINFSKDRILILNQNLPLETTSTGHYVLRISRNTEGPVDEVRDILFNVNVNDLSQSDLNKTAIKWHKQFAHPPADKLINLLSRAGISKPELNSAIKSVTANCETCQRYRRNPSKPVVAFPLATRFNETVALDLKDIRPGFKILHMVDHATRYGQAAVVANKSAQEIIKAIFDLWIRIFGCPEKMLMDNGGEFNNHEFLDMCDKCNIRVLTTAAESPWSNGLVEKHNGILGQMITKLLAEDPVDPKIATHWAVAAKNSLATVYGFSPNTLVFGRDPNLPHTMHNNIASNDPNFYSQLVKENLNALHKAREAFIHQESSEKLSRALNKQTRTYADKPFLAGDEIFFKRDQSSRWQGPAKVLGKDSNQILIKHGSSYLRVHPCRLLHKTESAENPNQPAQALAERKPPIPRIDSRSEDSQTDSEDEAIPKPSEVSTAGDSTIPSTETNPVTQTPTQIVPRNKPSINTGNPKAIPKKNSQFTYRKIGEDDDRTATCLGRAGRATAPTWHHINIHDHESDTKCCISIRDDIQHWEPIEKTENPRNEETENPTLAANDSVYEEPKIAELTKWKDMNVYTEVEDVGQKRISCRWVCTERLKAGNLEAKARLCARGCEDAEDVPTDSPTCERDNVRLLLSISTSFGWDINSIDFKSAYLQGEDLDRDIFLKPPKEANTKKLWRLNKCVYGINDAGKKWYNELKKYLQNLGAKISQLDQAVFYESQNRTLQGVVLLHVDDTLWAGNSSFETRIIKPLKTRFLVSSEEHAHMRYLGLSLSSEANKCTMTLSHYTANLQEIPINPDRSNDDTVSYKQRN